jgi:6-pyruvoyltetrahydropterin/6-carboxytetrahydropterin synthase
MKPQIIFKQHKFDMAHRVLNERIKCFQNHGHTVKVILKFSYQQSEDLGYAIDFKEIKRVGCQWIDDHLDHASILNPRDYDFIGVCKKNNNKMWLMSLKGEGNYCNPSAENIASEIFLVMGILFQDYEGLAIHSVTVYETETCGVECTGVDTIEADNWRKVNYSKVLNYAIEKGKLEYDDRKAERSR